MSLAIPISCVFDAFYFLSRPLLLDSLYFLSSDKSDPLNHIHSMTSLTILGLNTDPLVRALLPCVFDKSVGRVSGVGSGVFSQ